MKRITVTLSDDVAEELEKEVKENFRNKRGAVSIIVETALVKFFEEKRKG